MRKIEVWVIIERRMKRNKAFDSLIMVITLRGFIEVGSFLNIAESGDYATLFLILQPALTQERHGGKPLLQKYKTRPMPRFQIPGRPDAKRDDCGNEKRVIKAGLTEKMVSMVGFRNILVHEYQDVNMDIVYNILRAHLKDIDEYLVAVIDHFRLH